VSVSLNVEPAIWAETCTETFMKTLLFALPFTLLAQAQSAGVPVRITVTAEAKHGKEASNISREDVLAFQGNHRVTVGDWVPAQAQNAALELFMLIDDSADSTLGSQLNDLRQFVTSQPATTLVGVAYMRNGTADVLQHPTNDHNAAAKAIRLPVGAITAGASPYLSLSDLMKKWPANPARHEVVMISAGIDPLGGPPPTDPYLDRAIDDAQRATIMVHSIYTPSSGHFGHNFWTANWGQNYLSQLSAETGGESFMLGFGAPVSFAPYLAEIETILKSQYLATLLMQPGSKPGFESIRLATEVPNMELITQRRVYVTVGG
jgi:hypothetical protein